MKHTKDHNPLKSVAWLKMIYKSGIRAVIGYGSKAEAFGAYQHMLGNPKIEHVEMCDKEPK